MKAFISLILNIGSTCLLLLVLFLSVSRQPPPHPSQVVFVSTQDGNAELYRIDSDGKGLQRLTQHPADDLTPQWSPDGRWIAFVSGRSGQSQVHWMAARGGGVYAAEGIRGYAPRWSPDSAWITFYGNEGRQDLDLYRVNVQTQKIEHLVGAQGDDYSPVWSPDGNWLLFYSNRDGNNEIYRKSMLTGIEERLTEHISSDYSPSWSPDGQQIVFVSARQGNADIYRMRADGSELVRLTDSFYPDINPQWAGEHIFFTSNQGGSSQLYRMAPDGRGKKRLSEITIQDYHASSDGHWLTFPHADYRQANTFYHLNLQTEERSILAKSTQGISFSAVWSPIIDLPWRPGALLLAAAGGLAYFFAKPNHH